MQIGALILARQAVAKKPNEPELVVPAGTLLEGPR